MTIIVCYVFSASFSGVLICLSHDVFDLVMLGSFFIYVMYVIYQCFSFLPVRSVSSLIFFGPELMSIIRCCIVLPRFAGVVFCILREVFVVFVLGSFLIMYCR